MVLLTLHLWASVMGKETEQSMKERGGEEGRCSTSTNTKPHFGAPLPTAQACLLPQQHPQQPLPAPAARCPGSVAVGIGIPATPGDGQARKKGLIGHGGPETERLTGRC